ncbi:MAG: putative ATPase [Bacteroidia bacterium]|jgi:predicted ATPase
MQKIVIKNFGAIQDAEIEINKVLVLIGEQASGKSTIAKLIYFFKSLKRDFFDSAYNLEETHNSGPRGFSNSIKEKFYDFFGSPSYLGNFEIDFYYDIEREIHINLRLNDKHKLLIRPSKNFIPEKTRKEIDSLNDSHRLKIDSQGLEEKIFIRTEKMERLRKLSKLANEVFQNYQNSFLYIIAGRSATVSYSDLFEKYLFANLQNKLETNRNQSLNSKNNTTDESLMLSFIENVSRIKSVFGRHGSLEEFQERYSLHSSSNTKKLKLIQTKFDKILKGNYSAGRDGEKITISEDESVYLHNASSGQQESIRILQDIFLAVADNQKVLRIIEEPEAHLFPDAQKLMIELLALLANADEDNQVIITTHSPYVLSVFNNLLFAGRVIEKNESLESKVGEIVDSSSILSSEDFSAYSLQKEVGESKSQSLSILSEQTGLIEQNYLDTVSELLNGDFKKLYELHAKSFARA